MRNLMHIWQALFPVYLFIAGFYLVFEGHMEAGLIMFMWGSILSRLND